MRRPNRVIPASIFAIIAAISLVFFNCVNSNSQEQKQPSVSAAATAEKSSPSEDIDRQLGKGFSGDIPDWQARWELARLLSYSKRYAESLTEYEKLLKERPDLLEAKTEMATVLVWADQSERALAIFRDIPESRLNDEARMALADLYVAQKEYPKAEKLLRTHLEKFPDNQSVRLKLADLLSYEKRYEDSIKEYEIILQAYPNDIQVRRKYAVVLSWAGQRERAIKELQKTLK